MIFRTVLISLHTGLLVSIYLLTDFFFIPLFQTMILTFQIINMVLYEKKRENSILAYLESAINDEDMNIVSRRRYSLYRKIDKELEHIRLKFRSSSLEHQTHITFMETLFSHINIGLLSFDQRGNIDVFNKSARILLSATCLSNILDIGAFRAREKEVFLDFNRDIKDAFTLSNNCSLFIESFNMIQNGKSIRVITLQDIKKVLDKKEMDSWNLLIRTLNHEIMNSITPIASLASSVLSLVEHSDNLDLRESIEVIYRRSSNLLTFIENYKNLSQVAPPKREIVKVLDLFNRVRLLMSSSILEVNGHLTIVVNDGDLLLFADVIQVEQILINLIKNSIEAGGKKVILIGEISDSGAISLKVEDNGTGFTEETIHEAFVPFYTTKSEGTGLGLSIVRQIMHAHQGGVYIKNGDIGSAVELVFP